MRGDRSKNEYLRSWFLNQDGEEEYEVSESGSEVSIYASLPSPTPGGFELQVNAAAGGASPVSSAAVLSPLVDSPLEAPPSAVDSVSPMEVGSELQSRGITAGARSSSPVIANRHVTTSADVAASINRSPLVASPETHLRGNAAVVRQSSPASPPAVAAVPQNPTNDGLMAPQGAKLNPSPSPGLSHAPSMNLVNSREI